MPIKLGQTDNINAYRIRTNRQHHGLYNKNEQKTSWSIELGRTFHTLKSIAMLMITHNKGVTIHY